MLTITVNGKAITISDIMAGSVVKHYNDRYSLKIGFAVNGILTEYERECVGRKLIDLAVENEQLKADMKELIAGNENIHSIIDGTIKISGDMVSMIRIGLIDMFRSNNATNFLIQNLKDPTTGEEFTMTIQKTDALLPEQKYIVAQAENERLKAKLDAVAAECNKSRQFGKRLSALTVLDIIGGDQP